MAFFLTDDDVKLYYQINGSHEQTVVLIHGWSAHHDFYKHQIPVLSQQYTVVSYDLRGHGQSEIPADGYTLARYAQDLNNLLDHLKLDNVSLIGWSMGTHIIFEYVRQFGNDRLEKLILVDMSAKLITEPGYPHGLYGQYSMEDNLANLVIMNDSWETFADAFVPAIYATNHDPDPDVLKWNFEEALKNSATVMTRMWISMSAADYRDVLALITVPTLITYGADGALYKPENSEYLHENIAGSTLLGFENCGHGLMIEDFKKFNTAVLGFIG